MSDTDFIHAFSIIYFPFKIFWLRTLKLLPDPEIKHFENHSRTAQSIQNTRDFWRPVNMNDWIQNINGMQFQSRQSSRYIDGRANSWRICWRWRVSYTSSWTYVSTVWNRLWHSSISEQCKIQIELPETGQGGSQLQIQVLQHEKMENSTHSLTNSSPKIAESMPQSNPN